jgi:SnoaL-like domain
VIRTAHLLAAACSYKLMSTIGSRRSPTTKEYVMQADFRKVLLVAVSIATAPPTFADVITENNPADLFALHNVEIVFHQAASTKDLGLMMSLFADDAVLTVGGKTYIGKDQVRNYFASVAGSFQPQNKWVAYTPAQRIRIDIDRDKAHLYFECLYVDVVAKQIAAHTFSDDNMMRSGDKWLIKEMKAGLVPEL